MLSGKLCKTEVGEMNASDAEQRWIDIVIRAFERAGERPSLDSVYKQVSMIEKVAKLKANQAPKETVRRTLQRHCSTSPQYATGPQCQRSHHGLLLLQLRYRVDARGGRSGLWASRSAAPAADHLILRTGRLEELLARHNKL
jgi:hypothetical protein